jgi:hypothetical protein
MFAARWQIGSYASLASPVKTYRILFFTDLCRISSGADDVEFRKRRHAQQDRERRAPYDEARGVDRWLPKMSRFGVIVGDDWAGSALVKPSPAFRRRQRYAIRLYRVEAIVSQ